MATRFWVGGGSANTWAATANTNWATTSGGANNASVPTTTDVAVFDSNSGTGNSVIGASITIQSLECDGSSLGTGAYTGTLTHNTAVTLTLNTGQANTFRLSSGMTYTPASTSSIVTLTHTSGTANIKSNGQKLFALTVNGAGGTTQPLDTTLVNAGTGATLTLTTGTLDFNGGAGGPFAVTAYVVSAGGSSTRSLILGGTVTIGGGQNGFNNIWTTTTTGMTFTKNSANIVVVPPTTAITGGWTFAGGGLTFNNLTANTSTTRIALIITGANTFGAITVNSGWALQLPNSATLTATSLTCTGTQTAPVSISTNNFGGVATLSIASGTSTLTWGGLFGISASGGATFTATNAFDLGSNSGWVITPPSDETVTLNSNAVTQLDSTTGASPAGTVTTGASTTSVPTSAFTINGSAASGVVASQFVGRVVLFNGNTSTAGLKGAVAAITASSASNTPTLTVSPALPATPASGDTFVVI